MILIAYLRKYAAYLGCCDLMMEVRVDRYNCTCEGVKEIIDFEVGTTTLWMP